MKKTMLLPLLLSVAVITHVNAQDISASKVPTVVKTAMAEKYPRTTKVSWEIGDGNYEANWGGKSGEDSSAQFSPAGTFLEIVLAIPISQLPAPVAGYVKTHYNGAKIKEAGKVTDASGKLSFEAEIKGKDLVFDASGNFMKED